VALLGTNETLRVVCFDLGVVDVVNIRIGLFLFPKRRLFVVVVTVVVLVVVVVVVLAVVVSVVLDKFVAVTGAVVVSDVWVVETTVVVGALDVCLVGTKAEVLEV